MRQTPHPLSGDVNKVFDEGHRPPLRELPAALVKTLTERDELKAKLREAQTKVASLTGDHHDAAARAADQQAAAESARAGKPMPAADAGVKLEQDRAAAHRVLEAFDGALVAVTKDCANMAGKVYDDALPDQEGKRLKARAGLEAKAHLLADSVESAVLVQAAFEWLRTGQYYRQANARPGDLIPGLSLSGNAAIPVRDVIVNAATTVLDEEK